MLLKGKPVADRIIEKMGDKKLPPLTLAVFHPQGDAAAESYLKTKEKILKRLDWRIEVIPVTASMSRDRFFELLKKANNDKGMHGIMVELPLPIKIDSDELSREIDPRKDVDGVTFLNQGELFSTRQESIVPCTALGSIRLLEHYEIPLKGREVLVIGRSAIVGMPLFKLLLNRDATVTVAHSRTKDLAALAGKFDIVALATGKLGLISSKDLKDGAVAVDIGINPTPAGGIAGDMAVAGPEEEVRISYSPVPGGVGTVTNAVMLENLAQCFALQQK